MFNWLKSHAKKAREASAMQLRELREFVYLDEVSVTSLLSSRKGRIPHEFTEGITAAMKAEINGQVEAGAGVVKGRIGSKYESSRSANSQVVSKATVQTLFKTLYDDESKLLAVREPTGDEQPLDLNGTKNYFSDSKPKATPWIVEVESMKRGQLMEVEAELEADAAFQMSMIVSTFKDLSEESEALRRQLSGPAFNEMLNINRILESMLVGLIPIRCILANWKAAEYHGRDFLIHRTLEKHAVEIDGMSIRDVYVAADTEQDLYWKDIRRVLFDGSRFRLFCRVNRNGLTSSWNPIRLANVLDKVHPNFGQQMQDFSSMVSVAVETTQREMRDNHLSPSDPRVVALVQYAGLLANELHVSLTEIDKKVLSEMASQHAAKVTTVLDSRPTFAVFKAWMEERFKKTMQLEKDADLRLQALNNAGLGPAGPIANTFDFSNQKTATGASGRVIEAEVVAIYW
ncbi:MAG: hypothetical protein JWQ81_2460 [Amycolatopsis sp.]|uniref:DUF6414 family protein n=1 Tax=Amycolatopsis sp. TaxID=37632 RepID=UPI0026121584|nr:hypothetical protein [Amycolatopsis sp.]MCU1681721.1 hypothetical protein [Amycolatopsis sp.]